MVPSLLAIANPTVELPPGTPLTSTLTAVLLVPVMVTPKYRNCETRTCVPSYGCTERVTAPAPTSRGTGFALADPGLGLVTVSGSAPGLGAPIWLMRIAPLGAEIAAAELAVSE